MSLKACIFALFALVMSCFAPSARGADEAPSASASLLPSAIVAVSTPTEYWIDLHSVLLVKCGNLAGTAFVTGKDTIYTAEHVVNGNRTCEVNGRTFRVVYSDKKLDVASLVGDTGILHRYGLNCNGYKTGHTYYMVGYPGGEDFGINQGIALPTFMDVSDADTGRVTSHVRLIQGYVLHGMSGGPIIDSNGNVVGFVNSFRVWKGRPQMFSRELKDTPFCAKTPQSK